MSKQAYRFQVKHKDTGRIISRHGTMKAAKAEFRFLSRIYGAIRLEIVEVKGERDNDGNS